MRSLYRVTFAIVTIFVTGFSVVNMSGELLFARANSEPLSSLPSHFRLGYAPTATVAQYYNSRNQVGNLSGIARSELRSQTLAYTSKLQVALVDVYAAPNDSIVYSGGLTNFSGATAPGPGQVIVIRNSEGSSSLSIGQVIQANFSFYVYSVPNTSQHVNMDRNLTVAGFADATTNGFGYLTNSRIVNPGSNLSNLFSFTTLLANWDDLIPPLINFANSNKAEQFFTGLCVYVKVADFAGPDAGVELAKAQSLQTKIQSTTGGSIDSWLVGQLQGEFARGQFWVFYAMGIAIATGGVALILSFPAINRITIRSIEASRSRESKTSGSRNGATLNPGPMHKFNLGTLVAGTIGIGVGILISIPIVSVLIYSSLIVWTLTVETLFFNTVFGTAFATVIWLQSREQLGSIA